MTHYVIRVRGRLSPALSDAFPTLSVTPDRPQTTLHGQLDDQESLTGVLAHLDMLGVEILEVLRVPAPAPDD